MSLIKRVSSYPLPNLQSTKFVLLKDFFANFDLKPEPKIDLQLQKTKRKKAFRNQFQRVFYKILKNLCDKISKFQFTLNQFRLTFEPKFRPKPEFRAYKS